MTDSLSQQANKAALDQVKADAPQSFTVGAHYDGQTVSGGVSYDRKWSNGWGATAYMKAWWNDQAVLPQDKHGVVVGVEGVYQFTPK